MSSNGAAPARRAFEEWVRLKIRAFIGEDGRATSINPKTGRREGKISDAAIANAARAAFRIPIGKEMDEAEFDKLIADTKAIRIEAR